MNIIKSICIRLESGMLLSKEILEQMDLNSHLFKLQYDSYPDGIIYGFEYVEEVDKSYISSGLIKFNGKYFFSEEKIDLNAFFDEFDNEVMEKTVHSAIAFVPCDIKCENEGIVFDALQLKLCDIDMLKSEESLILMEFQYHSNKRITKREITSEEKLQEQLYSKGYDYTFINVNYSIPYEKTFSPYIFNLMRKCLSDKTDKTIADMSLLYMLCQNRVISFEVLKEWFAYYNISVDLFDRQAIINNFLEIIKLKSEHQVTEKTVMNSEQSKPRKRGIRI